VTASFSVYATASFSVYATSDVYLQYTLCLRKKRHPFYIHDKLVRHHPILLVLGRNMLQGMWNKHVNTAHHISILHVLTVPCKNWQQFLRSEYKYVWHHTSLVFIIYSITQTLLLRIYTIAQSTISPQHVTSSFAVNNLRQHETWKPTQAEPRSIGRTKSLSEITTQPVFWIRKNVRPATG